MTDLEREIWPVRSFIVEVGEDTCDVDSSFVPGEKKSINTAVSTTVLREAGVEIVELKIFQAKVSFDPDGGNIAFSEITPADGYMPKESDVPYFAKEV